MMWLLVFCLIFLGSAHASSPEPVSTAAAEPVGEGEPIGEVEPTPTEEKSPIGEGEPTAEGEPSVEEPAAEGQHSLTGESEPTAEPTGEPASEVEPIPEAESIGAHYYLTTILPPVILVFFVMGGIFMLRINYIYSKWKLQTATPKQAYQKTPEEVRQCNIIMEAGVEPLLSDFDKEVLNKLSSFSNTPKDLFFIALPALVSLAVSPIIIHLHGPLTQVFWNTSKAPVINDAIACFLTPAGLVYATSFGFAFQSAINKSASIFHDVTTELSMIDQIVTFANKLTLKDPQKRLEIYRAVKAEAIFMALQIENKEPSEFISKPKEDVKVKIWSVIDILKSISDQDSEYDREVNKILVKKIMHHIMQLNSICSDRMDIFQHKIHWLKWLFLESLGFFSFFGVMFIQTKSATLDLVICFITVSSISLLCYVVSDYDTPFSGFFRIDLKVFHDVVERIEAMFMKSVQGDDKLWYYPERQKCGKAMRKIWR